MNIVFVIGFICFFNECKGFDFDFEHYVYGCLSDQFGFAESDNVCIVVSFNICLEVYFVVPWQRPHKFYSQELDLFIFIVYVYNLICANFNGAFLHVHDIQLVVNTHSIHSEHFIKAYLVNGNAIGKPDDGTVLGPYQALSLSNVRSTTSLLRRYRR
ncbi:hypothetical protein N0V90_011172 [Kalmusia sp. IMI 367209]|nr:hypothetical protein N0V90_011172 [Kalmusia sp. IMI 367209]